MISPKDWGLLREGLALRDKVAGHFLVTVVGGFGEGSSIMCRDCSKFVRVDPAWWSAWWKLYLAAPDRVREILGERKCEGE